MDISLIDDKKIIKDVVLIHLETFPNFFLSFLGKGFLTQLYSSFFYDKNSNIIVAKDNNKVVGFLAYSYDYSNLFKYMIKTRLFQFAWFSFLAFLKKPSIFLRLIKSFDKSDDVKKKEKYVELASIGVKPDKKGKGIGSKMIDKLKKEIDFSKYLYINLETDSDNNINANNFYIKNGFILDRTYVTHEGRKMNEYHFFGDFL